MHSKVAAPRRTTRIAARGKSSSTVIRRTVTTRVQPYPAPAPSGNVVINLVDDPAGQTPPTPPQTPPPSDGDSDSSKKSKNGKRLRNFVFTLPNYTQEEYDWFINHHGAPTWLIVAKETCPKTGTPHLQGMQIENNLLICFRCDVPWPHRSLFYH